ncbi:ACT domain-containing protein [Drosera capensis]
MGILYDDVVVLNQAEKEDDPSVITVNCPDKIGLGCDLCRILLFFGLSITRVDVSTDGKWCYIVFWVFGDTTTRWSLVKKWMVAACPSCFSASGISYYNAEQQGAKPPAVFLLKFCCTDRPDVTKSLCELELTIKRVKVSTTPDGRVVDLFFVTDTRELLHTEKRQEDTYELIKAVLGDDMISCELEMVRPEVAGSSQASAFLPSVITEGAFSFEDSEVCSNGSINRSIPSIVIDDSLSPSHTLFQIVCLDHKGLLYDIMRTFKDYNVQISYGRGARKQTRKCELDLFIMQADGKKMVDPSKQNALLSRLLKELTQPLRVAVVSRGPDTELLVANPVELSGKGRPLVFYDITYALKMLNICIFSAEVGRHIIEHREWEVYRVLFHEEDCLAVPRHKIEEEVWRKLMGWD